MKVRVTLRYGNRQVTFVHPTDYTPWSAADFAWVEGNLECDCSRGLAWNDVEPFPEIDCGNEIELAELRCSECNADLLANVVRHKLSCSNSKQKSTIR